MKKNIILTVFLMIAVLSYAHDFEVDGIYYNITSSSALTVKVSYRGTSYTSYDNEYTGVVAIPEFVTYDEKKYSVTSIGIEAFRGCSGLTSVTIPNSVTSISSYAFYGCSGLNSITIPNSVTSIGTEAFIHCTGLNSITIPNSVTTIGTGAFYGCSGLNSITIPNSVTSIGGNAFYGCSGLNSITVETGNTKYDSRNKCNAIIETPTNTLIVGSNNTIIPNTVTSIGSWAFYNCSGLTSITIPNSVTHIGGQAFYDCSGLTSVTFGNSVKSIGSGAFTRCIGITSIIIPNSVTRIDDSVFDGCSGLTSITIPNGITSIGRSAFYDCKSLNSLTIPSSVTSIGEYAFRGCSALQSITSFIEEPFTCSNCWYDVSKDTPLYIPVGTKEKYQNTYCWNEFTNIIEFGAEAIEPAEEAQEVDMATLPDQMELNGIVIGDTYYNISTENGDGFDATNGCLVLNSQTVDADVDAIAGKPISDESVKNTFKGFIIKVPAGNGIFNVTAKTTGASALKVKIGNETAQAFQLAEQGKVEIPYTVAEPSYVYIYAGIATALARNANVTTTNTGNSVNIYGYNWKKEESTGISIISSEPISANNVSGIYTLNGCKLNGKLAQKGIYIVNGKKVVIK